VFEELRNHSFGQKIWSLAYGWVVLRYFVGIFLTRNWCYKEKLVCFFLGCRILADINFSWWANWVNFTILFIQLSVLRTIFAVLVLQDMQNMEFFPPHLPMAVRSFFPIFSWPLWTALMNVWQIFSWFFNQNYLTVEMLVFLEVWLHQYINVLWKVGLIFKASIDIQYLQVKSTNYLDVL
jgi:hypothetical protein